MKNAFKYSFTLLLMIATTSFAQDTKENNYQPKYLWDVSANIGSTLLWGDAASNENPFSRWFGEEANPSFGLVLNRKLSNTLGVQFGIQKGTLSGERSEWSGDAYHSVVSSETDFLDYHLALNVDFTSMFGYKPDRLVSIYAFAGIGLTQYDAESFVDGASHKTVQSSAVMVPWGGGVKFRLNEHWTIFGETNFRNTFTDDIDAYIGAGTEVNDIYSITGIGVTYHFGQKQEKDETSAIEPEQEAEEEVVETYTPVEIRTTTNLPTEVEPNSEYIITTEVNKSELNQKGVYELSIPENFYLSDVESMGNVSLTENALRITWINMPSENLKFTYKLTTGTLDKTSYILASSFEYIEFDEVKFKTFSNRLNLKIPIEQPVIEEALIEEVVVEEEIVEEAPLTEPKKNIEQVESYLEYRVQVAASREEAVSTETLQQQYGLEEEVKQASYKNSYKYTVGSSQTYSEAAQHAALSKVEGAYVVVFKEGNYITYLENTNHDIMDKDGVFQTGFTYKVQIAASKGQPYSIAKLAHKCGVAENQITEDKTLDWYQYTTGTFRTREEAEQLLNTLRTEIPDAYIVVFEDGVRN